MGQVLEKPFISDEIDDLGLSLEAFRLYCYLSSASSNGVAEFPGYLAVAEKCFKGTYPNAPKSTLKAKAIAAVKELVAFGVIRKGFVNRKEKSCTLTESSAWNTLARLDGFTSINIRKGRAGQTRKSRPAILSNPTKRSCAYKKYRDQVFLRDGHRCVYCGASERLTLDHVIPVSRGGSNEPTNLATCCAQCNATKQARTPQEWLGGEA